MPETLKILLAQLVVTLNENEPLLSLVAVVIICITLLIINCSKPQDKDI
jgi:hypothetical protein